ncbi:hypothetical protein WT06_04560 [Burkholderia anthina]|nr:hypothetical protein WT06_04560 [Burkholderia anthina]
MGCHAFRLKFRQEDFDLSGIDFGSEEPSWGLRNAEPVQDRCAHLLCVARQKRSLRNPMNGFPSDLEAPRAALVVSSEDDACMSVQIGQPGRLAFGREIARTGDEQRFRLR